MEVAVWQMIAGTLLIVIAGSLCGVGFVYRIARQKRRNDSETRQPHRAVRRRSSKGTE